MSTTPGPRQYVRIPLRGLKVTTLIPPAALPVDLVPPDGQPAGEPVIDLEIEESILVVRARLNGKSARRALKAIAEQGAENVHVVLQGTLIKPDAPGGPFVLDSAGLAVQPKTPKSE